MKVSTIAFSASCCVTLAGAGMLYFANTANYGSVDRSIYYDQPKHPVTPEMIRRTEAETAKAAPVFQVEDSAGNRVSIGRSQHPQFVYFVLDGCPCSVDAEPLMQALAKRYEGKADFLAVTDGDTAKAKDWSHKMLMPYPLVPDPKLKIIHAYGVTNSVNSLLIDQQGKVVKMWPGYSQDLLRDIDRHIGSLVGEPSTPFDVSYAPKKQATGCAYPPENP